MAKLPLMTPTELAAILSVPLGTIYAWSSAGKGPTPIKIGRHIRYRVRDVEAFLDEQAKDAG